MVFSNDCGQEEIEGCLIGIKFILYKLTKLSGSSYNIVYIISIMPI